MFAETETAKHILSKKAYYLPEETEPDQMLRRVASYIASAFDDEEPRQYWDAMFYRAMKDARFLPNSPCLVNAGRESGGLFACFVLGMDDNLESITEAKSDAMAITKAGGGWGIGLSSLRPYGSRVSGSTHGIAGGPVGFWETFSSDMRTMTQGGFRDAACMATIRVDHPDILKFIRAKSPENSIRRLLNLDNIIDEKDDIANVVVGLLKDPIVSRAAETYMSNFNISVLATDRFMKFALSDSGEELNVPTHFDGVEYKSINPKGVLNEIAYGMWTNGEPGILFIDRIRGRTRYNPEEITATNPCGEQPLPPNGSCCLGSINLAEHIVAGKFNEVLFRDTVRTAVRFLNNMVTLNRFPTKKTREWSLYHRSIGLGLMGFADALILMGVRYDSSAAVDFAHFVGEIMLEEATNESEEIFKEGYSRPISPGGSEGSWEGRNNHVLLSIAPTGTISLLAGCSPGVEPVFSEKILRVDSTGSHMVNHPLANNKSFVTLKDLHYKSVINIVAVFSEYIDSSISYTVNLPNEATVEDVKDAINLSWQLGCNGITIYRDGSRNRQVLNTATDESSEDPLARPAVLGGKTYKYTGNIDGEKTNLYVTLNSKDGSPYEVFVHTPHIKSMTELQLVTVVTRLSSLCMRYGIPMAEIVEQLRKAEGQSVTSVPAIITRALAEYEGVSSGDCPECGSEMMYTGGCNVCPACGHSSCG